MGGIDRSDSDPLLGDDGVLTGRVLELVERGLERYGAGDLEGALSEWEHALALDPECERAQEYAHYVRVHFSALVARFADAESVAEAAAEFDVPFGLEGLGVVSTGDLEAYEDMRVEPTESGSVDMGIPAGYEDLVEDDPYVADSDDVTTQYSQGFSDESTRDIRPPQRELAVGTDVEVVPVEDEHMDFDEAAETVERGTAGSSPETVDAGWEFDAAPTTMFEKSGREGGTSGEVRAPSESEQDAELEQRTGSGPTIELSPELQAVASYSEEPPEHSDEGIADALDAVAAGLESIDLSIEQPEPSESIRLGIPKDAESDFESTQAAADDRTAQRSLSDYQGLDIGDEFDRDMGDVIDQPAAEDAHDDDDDDDDREPLSITIEAGAPDEEDDDDLMPEVTIEAGDAPDNLDLEPYTQPPREESSGSLNIELGHLEQIDERMRDEESGIRPNQRVVLGSGQQPKAVEISFRSPGSEPDATGDVRDEQRSSRPPTQDPTISEASIDLDDSLLTFEQPTREHDSVRDVVAAIDADTAGMDADEMASRETSELTRSAASALTREFDRGPMAASQQGGSYREIASDMLNKLDEDAPAAEPHEARTRRRVGALIERAEAEIRDSQFVNAVIAVDLALQEAPESAVAQKVIHRHRDLLLEVYRSYLGVLTNVPALAVPMHELSLHEIDHRAAFLLSRIDGALTFDDILDVSGMSRLEAFRHLSKLLLQGVLEVR